MNLEKQIKRHIIGSRQAFFAAVLPGLEALCQRELASLSETLSIEAVEAGGITFSGRLTDLYLANLHLRTAGRILLRIGTFKATNFTQLGKKSGGIGWARYLPSGAIPACNVTAHHSRLYHSQAVAQHISQAITAYWQGAQIPPGEAMGQTLYVRILEDRVTFSLDSSGTNLYQRGLKRHGAKAPLRETMAAGILQYAGYRPEMPLVDPMCGSGTFSLEAAMMAKKIAPGMQRDFAFMQWPAFKPRQWQHFKKVAAQKTSSPPEPLIWASDIDQQACNALNRCIDAHALGDTVRVFQRDFFNLHPDEFNTPPGLLVINPPYGRRLAASANMKTFYRRLTAKLQRNFIGWRVALLVPDGVLDIGLV